MERQRTSWLRFALLTSLVVFMVSDSTARNPIRRDFFDVYPEADGGQLDDLPSNGSHCGVCHLDFDGGGARNPYGLAIEVGLSNGLSNTQAILAVEPGDADADGFSNLIEITDLSNWLNTPTFPGLSATNYENTLNVLHSELEAYLFPTGGGDIDPPVVELVTPNGGEIISAGNTTPIQYVATDPSGISHVNIFLSDDSGAEFLFAARGAAPSGAYDWFVPNRPSSHNRIRVEAVDNAGNSGSATSAADFTIVALPAGVVPTTLRDMDMPGTQPHEGAVLANPDVSCAPCHGYYDSAIEPWANWRGSMMAQAARDPLFLATMVIAEQDAPSSGDLCIRCHSPGGWQEGRSVDTSGGLLTAKDRMGVQCDFCHRVVDHNYIEGQSPPQDAAVLSGIDPLPLQYANGQFVNDPAPLQRGPYADAEASHQFVDSPFHRTSDMCGVCHDVSNPVFVADPSGRYVPNNFDAEHPDMDVRNMFPVERTYSEWTQSEYASTGVYAPEFAGNKPDGIVSSCQDCHMRDVTGRGCSESGAPQRSDLGLHDMMGGNTFVPDILPMFVPGEVDVTQLQNAKSRADALLKLAATLEVEAEETGLSVTVTNQTGHKLPSGYPEGRRVWLNIQAFDDQDALVFESGAYNFATGELTHDAQLKIYEIHPGISPGLAQALGVSSGPSFHFVLSDSIYFDNRIPPRGFTNAGFASVQAAPVGYTYEDSKYWDESEYELPPEAVSANVTLYYQTTSKEYIEFLRDENTTNSLGQEVYDAWVAQGMSPPVVMVQELDVPLSITTSADETPPGLRSGLEEVRPNPARGTANIRYQVGREAHVTIQVHDVTGRRVATLFDDLQHAGSYEVAWAGRDDRSRSVDAGVYFVKMTLGEETFRGKVLLIE